MKLVIPVAGRGTRMRPLTYSVPKPLVPIAGIPVIERIVDQVLATQGITVSEIIFITGHLKQEIEVWARDKYDTIPVRFVEQKAPNGTGAAIKLVEEFIDEDMMVIFADTLFDADLEVMLEDTEADGVIWTAEVDDPSRFGVVAQDEDAWMTELIEKPTEFIGNLVNIGLYYVKDYKSAFSMIDMLYTHEIKIKGEYNFPEALDLMAKNGKKIRVVPVEGWYDTGVIATTLETHKLFCKREETDGVHLTAVLENSTVDNCIIMEGARLYDCHLKNSIVGPRTVLRKITGEVIIGSDGYAQSESKED